MGFTAINDAIAAQLGTIAGIGMVHKYQRYTVDQSKFLELFQDGSGRIAGWCVSRKAVPAETKTIGFITRRHKFLLHGVYGLQDATASELAFQLVIEAIQDSFKYAGNLGGAAESCGPVQAELIDIRMFGPVLCHHAELTLEVEEQVAR